MNYLQKLFINSVVDIYSDIGADMPAITKFVIQKTKRWKKSSFRKNGMRQNRCF